MNIGGMGMMAGFAGFGAIGLLWGQIKNIFGYFSSFIIVSAQINGDAEKAMMAYCWSKLKVGRFGSRKFTGFRVFIKPKNRSGTVGYEQTGNMLTFFDGIKPLLIGENEHSGQLNVTFVRGTFKIEKLIKDAITFYDELNHGTELEHLKTNPRYNVRKFFGKDVSGNGARGSGKEEDSHGISPSFTDSKRDSSRLDMRPLGWTHGELGAPNNKTPFANLAYAKEILDFKNEIYRWHKSEQWFKDRGIPWRFGGGLFGPAGTGKTSLARAIGQELDMPIHVYDLTTMSNEELVNFWDESLSCAPCIVLFEDIDRIFDKSKNIQTSKNKAPLTLDCLLNCINGVQAANGILTLVTANDIAKLDPALGVPDKTGKSTRPGRLDRAVYFGILDTEGRKKIAERILSGFEKYIPKVVKDGVGETGAQFESRCAKIALEQYWEVSKKKEKTENNKQI